MRNYNFSPCPRPGAVSRDRSDTRHFKTNSAFFLLLVTCGQGPRKYLLTHHNLTPCSGCTSIKKILCSLPRCKKLLDEKLIVYYLPFLQSSSREGYVRFYWTAEKSWQSLTSLSVVAEGCSSREGRLRVPKECCCVPAGSHYSNRGGGLPSAAMQHATGTRRKRKKRDHNPTPHLHRGDPNTAPTPPKTRLLKMQNGKQWDKNLWRRWVGNNKNSSNGFCWLSSGVNLTQPRALND